MPVEGEAQADLAGPPWPDHRRADPPNGAVDGMRARLRRGSRRRRHSRLRIAASNTTVNPCDGSSGKRAPNPAPRAAAPWRFVAGLAVVLRDKTRALRSAVGPTTWRARAVPASRPRRHRRSVPPGTIPAPAQDGPSVGALHAMSLSPSPTPIVAGEATVSWQWHPVADQAPGGSFSRSHPPGSDDAGRRGSGQTGTILRSPEIVTARGRQVSEETSLRLVTPRRRPSCPGNPPRS